MTDFRKFRGKAPKGEADLLFEEDFELYVKKQLEDRGYTVFHSVYLPNEKQIQQIDLVAVKDYMVYCIECKSHYGSHWIVRRSNDWSYIDSRGTLRTMKNPVRQTENHLDALRIILYRIEDDIYKKYNLLAPYHNYIIVTKANITKNTRQDIRACHYNDIDDLLSYYTQGEEVDNFMHSLLFPILEENQDTSKERLQEHINYIEKNKKDRKYEEY